MAYIVGMTGIDILIFLVLLFGLMKDDGKLVQDNKM